ncbi:MAG: hypothetical protein RMK60_06675 [Burkholderiales bacterium]|nr:hypothetical protein [Burkholderiales bacterium]
MPEIRCLVRLSVHGGPTWTIDEVARVDAYDVIDVTIEPGQTDREVMLQPGGAVQVALLVIQSSLYGSEIVFKASDGAEDGADVMLLGPQMFGNGNVRLLGVAPRVLKISNRHPASDANKKARVQILVGRDAIP